MAEESTTFATRARSILWIDGEPAPSDALVRLLRLDGFDVEQAASGALGIAVASTREYDLILLDLRLPDVSGLEVLHELWRAGVKTPVIVLSGYGTIEAAAEASRLGAAGFQRKPLFYEDLAALARVVMSRRVPVARSRRSPQNHKRHDPIERIIRLLNRRRQASIPHSTFERALLFALVDPTVSTCAFGVCALAFRSLQLSDAGALEEAISRLRGLHLEVRMGRAGIWQEPLIVRALGVLDGAKGMLRETQLADELATGRFALARMFNRHTGLNFRDWKRLLRMRRVLCEIACTNEQIAQIAYAGGYEHPSQLNRDCAKGFGLTPKAFRSLYRAHATRPVL